MTEQNWSFIKRLVNRSSLKSSCKNIAFTALLILCLDGNVSYGWEIKETGTKPSRIFIEKKPRMEGQKQSNPAQVISPNGSEEFFILDTMVIQWRSLDLKQFNNCFISLSLDSGRDWYTITSEKSIVSSHNKWGNFTWVIPEKIWVNGNLIPCLSSTCTIRISQYGEHILNDLSDYSFSIRNKTAIQNPTKTPSLKGLYKLTHTQQQVKLYLSLPRLYEIQLFQCQGSEVFRVNLQGPQILGLSKRMKSPGFYLLSIKVQDGKTHHSIQKYIPLSMQL